MTTPTPDQALDAAVSAFEAADQTVEQENGSLRAQVTALLSQARPGCLFGDTPRSYSGGAVEVDGIYGKGRVLRQFSPQGLTAPLVTDRPVIGSWNAGVPTTAQIAAYRQVSYFHEVDHQIKAGSVTLSAWQGQMRSLASAVDPSKLCVILTADCFVNPAKNPADYLVPGVTHLGVDFDGLSPSPTDTGYHDYTAALAAVVAFCAAHGLTWGVPEFGANRGAFDSDGSKRALWLLTWAVRFASAGAEYVCVWEETAPQTGSLFVSAAEVGAVKTLLASNI